MLNREKHQLIMGQILKDLYTDISIAPLLGFKGGTCAYLFYQLPRFSVDLDFDLLVYDEKIKEELYSKIERVIQSYGEIKDQAIKKYTLFFSLSYGMEDHNIKIEINTRDFGYQIKDHYSLKEYLGISMNIANPNYLFASKLSALTTRNQVVMRDIFDIYFFAKNRWEINADVIQKRMELSVKEYLEKCIVVIEEINETYILQGLGELVDEKEKQWIKNNLKKETLFMLKNYVSVLEK